MRSAIAVIKEVGALMANYTFSGGNEKPTTFSGPLPEDDYSFSVEDYTEPYQKDNGNWVLKVRLTIKGQTVFDQPWSGQQSDGTPRDGIGEFLLCVNRAPKQGAEPDWRKLQGAHGKCRLKIEIAEKGKLAGKEINRVAWYYRPRELGPVSPPAAPKRPAPGADEPNNIPF
jgi:hypothetical protein